MPSTPSIPARGYQQLRKGRYSAPGATYFLTFCLGRRQTGLNHAGLLADIQQLHAKLADESVWPVRMMTLMPDHMHAVIRLGEREELAGAIRLFKGRAAVALRQRGLHWQNGGGFDHRMRPDEPLAPVFRYIYMNPYRKGLIPQTERWPFYYCCPADWEWFQHELNHELPCPEWLNDGSRGQPAPTPEGASDM